MEIILVDDGSTDSSGIICDEYAKEDVRISVIHKSNGGLVSARKAGANSATGEYIANVDGDDWIEQNYISNFVKEILAFGGDIIWSISQIKDYKNNQRLLLPKCIEELKIESNKGQEELLNMVKSEEGLQNDIVFSSWGKCVNREIYRKAQNYVDNRIIYGEDMACMMICLCLAEKVRFMRNDGYHYVQRESSIVNNRTRYSADGDDILLQNIMNYFDESGIRSFGLRKLIIGYYVRARILHDFGSLQDSSYGFLYPFKNVKKGSSIVLCGAGAVGRSIMAYLSTCKDYSLVAWLDSNAYGERIDGWQIDALGNVSQLTYDYIVLATNKVTYSQEMKKELIARGAREDKIEEMSQEVILSINI